MSDMLEDEDGQECSPFCTSRIVEHRVSSLCAVFSKFHILIALVHIHLAIFDCRCDAFARSHRHVGIVVFLTYFLLSEFHLVLFRFDSFVFICLGTLTIV